MSFPDALWDVTGEVSAARTQRALMESLYGRAPVRSESLSDEDVRRIAEAVCDEWDRRDAHPLRVTADDVRRWMGGRRG